LPLGKVLEINLTSSDFDTYLEVFDGTENYLDSYQSIVDYNSGEGTNSRLIFTPQADRNYILRVSNRNSDKVGAYKLNVKSLTEISAQQSEKKGELKVSDANYPSNEKYFVNDYQLEQVTPNKLVEIRLDSVKFGTSIEVYDARNQYVVASKYHTDGSPNNSLLVFKPQSDREYVVRISNKTSDDSSNGTGSYTLDVKSLPELEVADNEIREELTSSDTSNPARIGSLRDDYQLTKFTSKYPISLVLSSDTFDTYLQLVNALTQEIIASNDNSGTGNNSQLSFIPDGYTNYIVRVTSANPNATGNYTLKAVATSVPSLEIGDTKTDTLSDGDIINFTDSNRLVDDYKLAATVPGQAIRLMLSSDKFDTNLQLLESDTQNIVLQHRKSSDGSGSMLTFIPIIGKNYIVRVASVDAVGRGDYQLKAETVDIPVIENFATPIPGSFDNGDIINLNDGKRRFDEYRLQSLTSGQSLRLKLAVADSLSSYVQIINANTQAVVVTSKTAYSSGNIQLGFLPEAGINYIVRVVNSNLTEGDYTLEAEVLAKKEISANKNEVIVGALSEGDINNPTLTRRFADDYQLVDFPVGKEVQLVLKSPDFDSYLQLVNADTNKAILEDDDYGFNRFQQSFIKFIPQTGINYIVRVTSYSINTTGTYSISTQAIKTLPFTGESASGNLSSSDVQHSNLSGRYSDDYKLDTELLVGKPVIFTLASNDFNPQFQLINADTQQTIASNSETSVNNTAQLKFVPQGGTNYAVRVTSRDINEQGNYTLKAEPYALPEIAALNGEKNDNLQAGDIINPEYSRSFADDYKLNITDINPGTVIELQLESSSFTPKLQLINASNNEVINTNSFSGVGNNSRLVFTPEIRVNYIVRVTDYYGGGKGEYKLKANPLNTIVVNEPIAKTGNLNSTASPNYPGYESSYFINEYQIQGLKAGELVDIKLSSSDFNAYLELFDASKLSDPIISDDNSGGNSNARLIFSPEANKNYLVRVRTYGAYESGEYSLSVTSLATISARKGNKDAELNATEDLNYPSTDSKMDEYQLTDLTIGEDVYVSVKSDDFDTYLEIYEIENQNLKYLTGDDNSGEGTNSQIIFTPESGKKYLARISNYFDNTRFGNYTLQSSLPITSPQTRSRIDGALSDSDVNNPNRSGRKSDNYQLANFTVGQPINVILSSLDFDAYLQLINGDTGRIIDFNDNYNSTNNSRLTFTPSEGINYVVRVTSSEVEQLGNYTLRTREVLSGLGDKIEGKISETDANYPGSSNYYIDEYELSNLTIGQFFALELKTENFNPYLELINRDTDEIITVYGSGSSRIVFTPSNGINYGVRVTSYYGNQTGNYTLTSKKLPILSAITGTVNVSDTRLNDTDTKYPGTDYLIDEYQLTGLTTNETVYVGATSPDFNTYLEIVDASNGSYLTYDYDSGDGTNSRLYFTPELGKKYLVRVGNYGTNGTGAYTLSTRKQRTEISLYGTSSKQIDGSITYEDELDAANSYYSDEYLLTSLPTNKRIVLDISSEEFYTSIELLDANTGKTISNSFTRDSSRNSKLIFTPQQGVSYAVRVRGDNGGTGNYTLNINELAQAVPNSPYGSIILADQPVGYWSLDETTGEIAADYSGYGNNASYRDGVTLGTTGISLQAATFDGENDTLDIPINSPETNYTYELWFKTREATTGISIVRDQYADYEHDRVLYLKDGNIYHGLWSTEIINSTGKNYADDEWHYVTVVVESSVGQKVYVDGELVASGNKGESNFSNDTRIVAGETLASEYYWGIRSYFKGTLDEIALYNYVLPESRIDARYEAFLSQQTDKLPDLAISPVTYPSSPVTWGQTIPVSWIVQNIGNVPTTATWTDKVYFSTDKNLSIDDQIAGTFLPNLSNPLAAKVGQYTLGGNIVIPNTLDPNKNWYLLFVTDADYKQLETNSNNNVQSVALNVNIPNLRYFNNFESPVGDEWTNQTVDKTYKNVFSSFLGRFSSDGTTLTLNTTPGNTYRLEFDFYAIDSWDGSQNIDPNSGVTVGPDYLDISVDDTRIFRESFSNIVDYPQSYNRQPDVGGISNDLGFNTSFGDSIYRRVPINFTATGNTTQIRFADYGLQGIDDESWGIDNVRVFFTGVNAKLPTLKVTDLEVDSTAKFGKTLDISWYTSNTGTDSVDGIWSERVWLSKDSDSIFEPQKGDYELRLITPTTSEQIAANSKSTQRKLQLELPLDNKFQPGNYYIIVETDTGKIVREFKEDDNVLASSSITITFPPLPDLTVSKVNILQNGIPGESIDVSWQLGNIGDVTLNGTWNEDIYLIPVQNFSADGSFSFDSIQPIKTVNRTATIGAKQQLDSFRETIEIPGDIIEGEYRVVVITDTGFPNDKIVEYDNATNNMSISTQTVRVGRVDLVPEITTFPTEATSGKSIKLNWKATLNGAVGVSRELVDRIYLLDTDTPSSYDLRADNAVAEVRKTRTLSANGSYTEEIDIPLPIELSGRKYVFVVTDADNQLKEASSTEDAENNNTIGRSVQINLGEYADLAVSNITATPQLTLRDQLSGPATLQVNWTVTNIGTGAGKETQWYDRVIASSDNITGNDDDIVLGTFLRSSNLAKDSSYNKSETIQLAANFTGKYQLFVTTDAPVRDRNNEIIYSVFENGLETNNTASAPSPFAVALKPYADLIVTKVSIEGNATTAQTGRLLKLNWEVKNQGIAVTDSASWSDTVQLAQMNPDGTLSIVTTLDYFDRTGVLGNSEGNNTYTRSRDVFIPYNTESGTYYLVVTTGGSDNPYEFIYYNDGNSKVSPAIQITKGTTPDLYVSRVSTVEKAVAGSKIDVTWQVFNSNAPNTGDAGGEWTDNLYLRNLSNPAEIISLGSFNQTNGLQPGRFYTRTEQVDINPYLQGTYEVVVETNSNRGVFEEANATENNTLKSTSNITISLPTRPDLRVNSITVPATTVVAGGTATASFEIINLSPIEARGKWVDNVYLSLDGSIDSSDILIDSFTNDSAVSGQGKYSHNITNFEIPKYFRGKAHIIVQTDAYNAIDEYPQDDNNILVREFNVQSLLPADLVTSNVIAPNQAFAGSTIKVKYKVTNSGSGETDRESWTDSVWLTRTNTNRPSAVNQNGGLQDIKLGNFTRNGGLQTKNDYNGTNFYENEVEVTLPGELQGGGWYITVWSNPNGDVYEDSFSNNTNQNDANNLNSNNYSSRAIEVLLPAAPDLQVTQVTQITPAANATTGKPFKVTWTVENKGSADITSGTWYDEVYLTDAPTLEATQEKWLLGTIARTEQLGRNARYTGELETVLSPGAKGKYIVVTTNTGGYSQIWEGPYSNNNTKSTDTNVTSIPADFTVTNIKTSTPNYSGDPTTIEWTVTNNGAPVWTGTRYWYDEVWISKTADFTAEYNRGKATWLGLFAQNLTTAGLGTGQSYTQKQNIVLPAGFKDDYYIHVFTNESRLPDSGYFSGLPTGNSFDNNQWRDLIYPTTAYEDTSNNSKSQKIPVTYREADLAISNLQVETPLSGINPKSGETIAVTWTVKNNGTRDTRESTWYDRVYLSVGKTDNTLDAKDIFLGEFKRNGILNKDDSYTQRQQFILPDGIFGDFKVLVFTDSNYAENKIGNNNLGFEFGIDPQLGRVPEFDQEVNNKAFADITIDLATPPDLQVTALNLGQQTAISGQKLNLSYTVTNVSAGSTPTRQSIWTDLIYLSRDNKLDLIADRYLGNIQHDGGLAAFQSYSVTNAEFNLPTDLTGSYYVFVVTDPQQSNPRGIVYEGSNEANNAKYSDNPLIIQLPNPVDLEVQTITTPGSSKVGEAVTVKWTVANNSTNSITGEWTDAVYLSEDNKWDISDRLLGRTTYNGTLAGSNATDGSNRYELSLDNILLPGVTPSNGLLSGGAYRIIVRNDIFNEVYEGVNGGETNNTKPGSSTFEIKAEELKLNIESTTTLSKGQDRLFALNLQAGQTIHVTTDGSERSLRRCKWWRN
jgi:hypothetical protein